MKRDAIKREPVDGSRRVSLLIVQRAAVASALAGVLATPALGQEWTVTNLNPAGATGSAALGVWGGGPAGVQVVGSATLPTGAVHASLWADGADGAPTAASWTDLNPPGVAGQSIAYGTDGVQQVGLIVNGTQQVAVLWAGTADSFVVLNPFLPFGTTSVAYGVANGQQVGGAGPSGNHSAVIWNGQPIVVVDLGGSSARATDGVQQVGSMRTGSFPIYGSAAMLWAGSAASAVLLEPADAYTSGAYDVDAGQQVGWVKFGGLVDPTHACLWTGSAASLVDLHPAGADRSEAHGVSAGVQAGFGAFLTPADPFNAVSHAGVWFGTAASWVDLHEFLPEGMFANSQADGVWSDGVTTYVVGSGGNISTGRTETLLWTLGSDAACAADLDGDADADVFDLLAYLDQWFAGDAAADLDGAGGVDVFDLLAFLDHWFAGCGG